MNMDIFKGVRTLVIHSGVFHADDVFTAAYVSLLKDYLKQPPIRIVRTFNVQDHMTLDNGFLVADIGRGEFDHHFPESQKQRRDNGNPYAAFGLVVREFHEGYLNDTEYELFDKIFVEPIDYTDNTGAFNQLSQAIKNFNKQWDDDSPDNDLYFDMALALARNILSSAIRNCRSSAHAKEIARGCSPDHNGVIYLDEYAPINEFFTYDDSVKFVGSPSKRGTYQIVCVKDGDKRDKAPFPKSIRGIGFKPDEYDAEGLNFCHPSGFMASFKDMKTAKAWMDNHIQECIPDLPKTEQQEV